MAEAPIPVSIGRQPSSIAALASTLGQSAADVTRLHLMVIDREDRLESGTGDWLSGFREDADARGDVSRESVLRALRIASDATNFEILRALTDGVGTPVEELAAATGLPRLALAERIGDLISAGLAAKIPEANQITGVPAGTAIVELVTQAADQAARVLAQDV